MKVGIISEATPETVKGLGPDLGYTSFLHMLSPIAGLSQ